MQFHTVSLRTRKVENGPFSSRELETFPESNQKTLLDKIRPRRELSDAPLAVFDRHVYFLKLIQKLFGQSA